MVNGRHIGIRSMIEDVKLKEKVSHLYFLSRLE